MGCTVNSVCKSGVSSSARGVENARPSDRENGCVRAPIFCPGHEKNTVFEAGGKVLLFGTHAGVIRTTLHGRCEAAALGQGRSGAGCALPQNLGQQVLPPVGD